MMSRMSETALSCVDNLEIGRYGSGSIKWPGLTDVRGLDLDELVQIEQGSLTLYPDLDKPKVGEGLNKEAVITLNLSMSSMKHKLKSAEVLKERLTKLSEEFGGRFISYDSEKWIFHMPHFNGASAAAD